jgi:hypothetical protein
MPKTDADSNISASRQRPRDALDLLNSILEPSSRKQVSESQLMIILDALAGAQDPALVARFPAVLAIFARRGIALDSQKLFSRYWESSPKRKNLERLLSACAELFRGERIHQPHNLEKIAESLRAKLPSPPSAGTLELTDGPAVSVADMRAALRQFAADLKPPPVPPLTAVSRRGGSPQLDRLLGLLFSAKQKELVFKRLKGLHLSKTEREYFSRVVKKKLAAVADPELQGVAARLIGPEGRKPPGRKTGGDLPP